MQQKKIPDLKLITREERVLGKEEGKNMRGEMKKGFFFLTAGVQPAFSESSFKVAPVQHGGGESGELMWAQCVR